MRGCLICQVFEIVRDVNYEHEVPLNLSRVVTNNLGALECKYDAAFSAVQKRLLNRVSYFYSREALYLKFFNSFNFART